MNITEFDFHLPEELIATRPVRPRSAARMLVCDQNRLEDLHVQDLPDLLSAGDLLVFNDTKVLPARLAATRARGEHRARVSLTLSTPHQDGTWDAFAKPLRKLKAGEVLDIGEGFSAHIIEKTLSGVRVRFLCDGVSFHEALALYGRMPLPPYIATRRAEDEQDTHDYQTIFAEKAGAIAAPTAALHFDDALRTACLKSGAKIGLVTLHVGAGTFLPIKEGDISTHKMHAEWGEISRQTAAQINQTHRDGGRVIAVGTTSLRVLETAADEQGRLSAWTGKTDIFIKPGYKFKSIDMLMTNFHLPKSTLIILISAFCGVERAQQLYRHAVENRYRFYSYGDSSLLTGFLPLAKSANSA